MKRQQWQLVLNPAWSAVSHWFSIISSCSSSDKWLTRPQICILVCDLVGIKYFMMLIIAITATSLLVVMIVWSWRDASQVFKFPYKWACCIISCSWGITVGSVMIIMLSSYCYDMRETSYLFHHIGYTPNVACLLQVIIIFCCVGFGDFPQPLE